MDDENGEVDPTVFDRIILQVFEEQEDRCGSLRYPLSTQRHALDFVKLINRKGFPYVLMCQAIDEKQEKFRSWRLGNGNSHIGLVMMKRINKTVQEAMMLPDADVDIDELIDDDDDDDDDKAAEIAADELTTDDEDELHPVTSTVTSSSPPSPPPPAATPAASEIAASETDAATVMTENELTTAAPTDSSTEDEAASKDKPSDFTDSQANTTELPLSEQLQDQLKLVTGDNDLVPCEVEVEGKVEATDELRTEDKSNETTGTQEDQDSEPVDGSDHATSLTQDTQEGYGETGDEAVEVGFAGTPNTCRQVSWSSAAESSPSSASSSASSELPQSADAVSSAQTEFQSNSKNNVKIVTELAATSDEAAGSEHWKQEDVPASTLPELEQKNDLELDPAVLYADKDQSLKQEQKKDGEDVTKDDVGKRPLSGIDDELTLQKDGDTSGNEVKALEEGAVKDTEHKVEEQPEETHKPNDTEQIKATEEPKVEEESKMAEEVTVVYEASAKQLDLLSRLAMLKEKAAQRKSLSTDSDSRRDSQDTTSGEDQGLSRSNDDSTTRTVRSSSLHQDDVVDVVMAADVISRTSACTDVEKEAPSETDMQEDVAGPSVTTDGQKALPTPSDVVVENRSHSIHAASAGHEDPRVDTGSAVQGEASVMLSQTQSTDKEFTAKSEHMSTSTTHQTAFQTSPDRGTSTAVELSDKLEVFAAAGENVGGVVTAEERPFSASDIDVASNVDQLDSENVSDNACSASHRTLSQTVSDRKLSDSSTAEDLTAQSEPCHSGSDHLEPTVDAELAANRAATESSNETTQQRDRLSDNVEHSSVNYDSDLDPEFADTDTLGIISHIQTLKSNTSDGPGYLYVFTDGPNKRFKVGASRSPSKRLRQATAFNPDMTSLVSAAVPRRRAAVREFRRSMLETSVVSDVTFLHESRDWFTGSDDVVRKLVRQVAAVNTTNN